MLLKQPERLEAVSNSAADIEDLVGLARDWSRGSTLYNAGGSSQHWLQIPVPSTDHPPNGECNEMHGCKQLSCGPSDEASPASHTSVKLSSPPRVSRGSWGVPESGSPSNSCTSVAFVSSEAALRPCMQAPALLSARNLTASPNAIMRMQSAVSQDAASTDSLAYLSSESSCHLKPIVGQAYARLQEAYGVAQEQLATGYQSATKYPQICSITDGSSHVAMPLNFRFHIILQVHNSHVF